MESVILQFFSNIFHGLAIWFNESIIGSWFNRLSGWFATVFRDSMLGRFFACKGERSFFKESLFCKLLKTPVIFCQFIGKHIHKLSHNTFQTSGVVWLLANWHSISIRIYGTVLLSFSITYGIIRIILAKPTLLEACLVVTACFASLLCILINRSIKSLFKGSRIAMAVSGLFCEIRKDIDSKLFLKDPELILARPLFGIFIGFALALPVAILQPPLFFLLLGGIAFVTLVIYSVSFGVFFVIMATPFLPTMVLAACCLLTVLSFFLRILTHQNISLRPVPMASYIAFFGLTLVLGTLTSFTFIKSMQILFLHIVFIAFYFVAFQALSTSKKWRGALVLFLLSSGVVSLLGIYQNFAGVNSTASWVDAEMFNQIKVRVYATFGNPNVLGEYLIIMISLALAVIWKSKTNGQKTIYCALFAALGLCMIFTWSRGAWLGVVLAAVLFLLIMDKRWTLVGMIAILALPMLLGADSPITDRILSIGNTADSSTAYRVSIWQASINMIQDFWMNGIGLGSDAFSMIYPKYAMAGANFALHSHNLFLQIWVETGIAGIISFLVLILAFVRQSISLSMYQNRCNFNSAIAIALATGLLGFMFQGLTDNVWYNYKMLLIFWIVMAFAGSVSAPDFNAEGGGRV
ncbi:MAG: hypothetical protein E7393_00855 [Ruminococcaceae bacterium]|nr:hypothetical protein [Oscillospiraceae bacterium]